MTAIVGTDPLQNQGTQGDIGPKDYFNKPGAHRYIGIAMVLGLGLVVCILWLTLARWPREKMRKWGWLKPQPESEESGMKGSLPRIVDEIIPPKEPEKAAMRKGSEHRGRQRAVASWEAEIDYKVSWEMKQHPLYYETGRVVPSHRMDYMPPERRSHTSR